MTDPFRLTWREFLMLSTSSRIAQLQYLGSRLELCCDEQGYWRVSWWVDGVCHRGCQETLSGALFDTYYAACRAREEARP